MFTLSDFLSLPSKTRTSIISMLTHAHRQKRAAPHERMPAGKGCPFCGNLKYRRNGSSPSGVSRYQCVECGKTYSTKTGTALHGLKKQALFGEFMKRLLSGYKPLHVLASEVGISVSTAFAWKHRILHDLSESEEAIDLIFSILMNEASKRKHSPWKNNPVAAKSAGSLLLSIQHYYASEEEQNEIWIGTKQKSENEKPRTGKALMKAPQGNVISATHSDRLKLMQILLKGVSKQHKKRYSTENE